MQVLKNNLMAEHAVSELELKNCLESVRQEACDAKVDLSLAWQELDQAK